MDRAEQMRELYAILGKLRDKYDVVISVWSREDVENVMWYADEGVAEDKISQIWSDVKEGLDEALTQVGNDYLSANAKESN
jgi:hypothetical protein